MLILLIAPETSTFASEKSSLVAVIFTSYSLKFPFKSEIPMCFTEKPSRECTASEDQMEDVATVKDSIKPANAAATIVTGRFIFVCF
ncbi:hypothetical protein D3C85_1314130 [compost metagenome]